MKKVDLLVYRDKIRKLHKAAKNLKDAHDEYERFQNEKLITEDFDAKTDWDKLTKYFKDNPDLTDKIDEVEGIIKDLNTIKY